MVKRYRCTTTRTSTAPAPPKSFSAAFAWLRSSGLRTCTPYIMRSEK